MFGEKGKGGRNGGHAVETLIGPRVIIHGDAAMAQLTGPEA